MPISEPDVLIEATDVVVQLQVPPLTDAVMVSDVPTHNGAVPVRVTAVPVAITVMVSIAMATPQVVESV